MSKSKIAVNKANDTIIKTIIVVFTFILYAQTIKFDFTLDDETFYVQNSLVQGGIKNAANIFTNPSIGEQSQYTSNQPYRPLTILVFAIEHTLFNNNTAALHFFNLFFLLFSIIGFIWGIKKIIR